MRPLRDLDASARVASGATRALDLPQSARAEHRRGHPSERAPVSARGEPGPPKDVPEREVAIASGIFSTVFELVARVVPGLLYPNSDCRQCSFGNAPVRGPGHARRLGVGDEDEDRFGSAHERAGGDAYVLGLARGGECRGAEASGDGASALRPLPVQPDPRWRLNPGIHKICRRKLDAPGVASAASGMDARGRVYGGMRLTILMLDTAARRSRSPRVSSARPA